MLKDKIIGTCASALLLIPGLAAAQAQSTAGNPLVGYTKVETISSYKGPELLPKPDKIVIYDFFVPADAITIDKSIAAGPLGHGPVGQLLPGRSNDDSSPEKVTEHVQDSFARALIKELE